jgi:hypothetical protein
MNELTLQTTVMPIVRHGVTALGTYLAATGASSSTIELVTGLVLAIVPVLFSVYGKRKAAQ